MGKVKNQNVGKVIVDINPDRKGSGSWIADFKYPYEIFTEISPITEYLLEEMTSNDGDFRLIDLKIIKDLKQKVSLMRACTLNGKDENDPHWVKKYKEKEPDETWQEVSIYLTCEYEHKYTISWKDFIDELWKKAKACHFSPMFFKITSVQNIWDFILFLDRACDANKQDSNEESEE